MGGTLLLLLLVNACGHSDEPASSHPSGPTTAADARPAVIRVGYSVSDLEQIVRFYQAALDFEWIAGGELKGTHPAAQPREGRRTRFARLQLGSEVVELVEYTPPGRPIPESASNDLWFQHLAIVVSDIDAAARRVLAYGATAVSLGGPRTLPDSNEAAGGIRAFYFRDPEDHVLELISYPPGKGRSRWQEHDRLFLGIDHTAIGVADTSRSRAFYEGVLGFEKTGESLNQGPEQAALSGVQGARVAITGFAGRHGPGIELLRYLEPGAGRPMPPDTRSEDLWHWQIILLVPDREPVLARAPEVEALRTGRRAAPVLLRDPDGHAIRLVTDSP